MYLIAISSSRSCLSIYHFEKFPIELLELEINSILLGAMKILKITFSDIYVKINYILKLLFKYRGVKFSEQISLDTT